MSRSAFSTEGLQHAAKTLGVDVATIRAVAEVESNGSGFLPDGRPRILFERHIFRRLTAGKWDSAFPNLSNAAPGGYLGGEEEYDRLYRALQLDGEAATQSASWGATQIMGFNWRDCGEKSLWGFIHGMYHDMDAQLGLFVEFIKSKALGEKLRQKDWAGFARIYNGPDFRKNGYDTKLANAYKRHAGAV